MPESICRTFATFTSSFEDIQYHATQISLFNTSSTLVDLAPSSTQVPLLGFPKTAPPLTSPLLVHSKPRSPPKRHPLLSARDYHSPNMFRPCRSSRLRRFTPCSTLQAYCILQPIMGFTTFQAFSFRRPDKSEDSRSTTPCSTLRLDPTIAANCAKMLTIPSGVLTLQSFPLTDSHSPSPRQAAFTFEFCPLVVATLVLLSMRPKTHCRPSDSTRPQGFSSISKSVVPVRRCRQTCTRYSLGLFAAKNLRSHSPTNCKQPT